MAQRMMAEGWFCPGCQAYHGPQIDTCEIASYRDKFVCNICNRTDDNATRCERTGCPTHVLVNGLASRELH